MEDDNDLLLSLLEQDHQHVNSTDDDAILSQLLASGAGAASNKHTSTNKSCCCCCSGGCKLPKDKEVPALFTFAILNWVGLILILFANYTSCNLIHVAWNTGSIHLSITGLGISRYQQKQKDTTTTATTAQCYDQICYVQHAEISHSDHFLPYTDLL